MTLSCRVSLKARTPPWCVNIDDCTTTLLFPFVTNKAGFDTGIAITNTSEDSGSCTITHTAPMLLTRWDVGRSRGGASVDVLHVVLGCTGIPGLYHGNLWISGCARLCLHLQRLWRSSPPWRRVISRCARRGISDD